MKVSNWVLARTQVNREAYARLNVLRQGRQAYLPRIVEKVRVRRGTDHVIRPLFPTYLFVDLGETRQWHFLKGTFGVTTVLAFGESPEFIPLSIIKDLRARESKTDSLIRLGKPSYAKGDALRIKEGAFKDHIGIYEGMNGPNRVKILLELLGRTVAVSEELLSVEAA